MLNTRRKNDSEWENFNSYEQEEKGKIIIALNIFVEAILGDNKVRFFLGVLIDCWPTFKITIINIKREKQSDEDRWKYF